MIDADIKKLYHCTTEKNLGSILNEGLKKSYDGIYFCNTPSDAAKFLIVRGVPLEEMRILEIDRDDLNDEKLDYSFDHSPVFFQCEAYVYMDDVPADKILDVYKLEKQTEPIQGRKWERSENHED